MGGQVSDKHRRAAAEAWAFACKAADSKEYDLIVLDEIFAALKYSLIELDQTLDLLRDKPDRLHLILTGRDCPPEIIELADTVTNMEAVKHHLAAGVAAQAGIEY